MTLRIFHILKGDSGDSFIFSFIATLNKYVLSIYLLLANTSCGKLKNEYNTHILLLSKRQQSGPVEEIMILSKLNTTIAQHTGSENTDLSGVASVTLELFKTQVFWPYSILS